MNRHINYNELLDALFEQWEDSYEQAEKDRFCRDGLLLKANPSLNINELWENSPLRVAFLLKDNPHGGQDIRGWLIDEKNGSINQNLENDFIKNIALIFYGILKTSQGQRYGYSEVMKTKMQDVIREWNTTPFALIECKKNAGGSIVSLQEMKNAFKDYGNFISKELDILKPNVLICCDGEDSQYDFVTKEYLSCSKFEEKKYYHPAYKEKLECCIRYYENENIYVIKSYHPSYRGDASRIYERVISPFGGLINALKKKEMASLEHDLFIEWMSWLKVNDPKHGFMYDGIVCQEDWNMAKKHILFVLKDYNSSGHIVPLDKINLENRDDIRTNIFNLRYYLQKGINDPSRWRVWDNVARWSYGLLNLNIDYYPPFKDVDEQGDKQHRSNNLKRVAVLDIKKGPGSSSCNIHQLNRYLQKHPESLVYSSRQLELYGKLDYVICCGDGVFDAFMQVKDQRFTREQYEIASSKTNYCLTNSGTIIIRYTHPLLLQKNYNKENAYNNLMKIAQGALLEKVNMNL